MAQQPKVVKMGPGRNAGPRPKVENPGKVFKRILAYVMKQYKFQVILVLCCILLGVFAQVQGTLFMQTLIDSYILPLLAERATISPACCMPSPVWPASTAWASWPSSSRTAPWPRSPRAP